MSRPATRGFTLLETLVVIVLLGVLLGTVTLVAGPSTGRQARDQATGLLQVLHAAREAAVLDGRKYGLLFRHDSYRLLRLQPDGWQPVAPLRSAGSLRWTLAQGGLPVALGPEQDVPQVWLLTSDEYSPFELQLEADGKPLVAIIGDGLNEPAWHE